MNYFYIYSAGGGAGDWNGIKRVWKSKMPPAFKQNVLLKFGDIYFNHASNQNLVKPRAWRTVDDIRSWLSTNVQDQDVISKTDILLDCGTSKIVNYVATQTTSDPELIMQKFDELITAHRILDKYADVIKKSFIKEAVTFDIPNTFKIRTQSRVTRTIHFNASHSPKLLILSSAYANGLYDRLDRDSSALMTTIHGSWSVDEITKYLSLLKYVPKKIAVGGLTNSSNLDEFIHTLNKILPFSQLDRVHFLGAGGIKSSQIIKSIYNGANASVDNSTPMNRAIDGNTTGTSQSGYFDYTSHALLRISLSTISNILNKHKRAYQPLFSLSDMNQILDQILLHQSGHSSEKTYNARAMLSIHNHDVFRRNAI